MANRSKETRQALGCGFEESDPAIHVAPWDHPGRKGPRLETCPGYTVDLPEVQEIARLRVHWEKGALAHVLEEKKLTELTQTGIHILEAAVGELHRWQMTPKDKGGGRE